MCSFDVGDGPKIYKQKDQQARKNHICSECDREIAKGEKYRYVFGVWDSSKPIIFKTCAHCIIPQEWLLKECSIFMHGHLYEEIMEHANEYSKIFLYRWAILIRRKWKTKLGALI